VEGNFRVGEWLIEPTLNSISANGDAKRLEPKIMQVLVCLAERPGALAPKEQLLRAVWPDIFVTEDVLTRSISELRKAFHDDSRAPRFIQTIPKGGYRLIAPVELVGDTQEQSLTGLAAVGSAPASPAPASPSTGRGRSLWVGVGGAAMGLVVLTGLGVAFNRLYPHRSVDSIAVLPFSCPQPGPGMDDLGDGMAQGVINALSQLSTVHVMAFTTVSRYRGPDVDLKRVGNELKVQAVLTGRIIGQGDTLTVEVELVNAADGTNLWGSRYERKRSDIFLAQEIARQISDNLSRQLSHDPRKRLAQRYTESGETYRRYLQGRCC